MNLPIVITPSVARMRGLVPEVPREARLGRWRVSYRQGRTRSEFNAGVEWRSRVGRDFEGLRKFGRR
jgi:hypothetical protein